jgi:hypothetical protein
MVLRKADKIRIVQAEGTAGSGNLLHIGRAIDETIIGKNYPSLGSLPTARRDRRDDKGSGVSM